MPNENLVSKINLPNDSLAILLTEYYTTTWGDQLTSELYFAKSNNRKILLSYLSGNQPSLSLCDGEYIREKWDYSKLDWNPYEKGPNINWRNVIKLSPNNLGVEIDLGLGVKYLITWNEKGEEITFSKIQ